MKPLGGNTLSIRGESCATRRSRGRYHRRSCATSRRERKCRPASCRIGALYAGIRRRGAGPNDYPRAGFDGLSIFCVVAGGTHIIDGKETDVKGNETWNIEGRASNCTMKDDPHHRCWVRHGTVGERVTVDKNGRTCGAGAGSFFMGPNNSWHGFIRDGMLTP